jgi:hypothetical protein
MNKLMFGAVFALTSVYIVCVYANSTENPNDDHLPLIDFRGEIRVTVELKAPFDDCGENKAVDIYYPCRLMALTKWKMNTIECRTTRMQCITMQNFCCHFWDESDCTLKEAEAKCNAEQINKIEKYFNSRLNNLTKDENVLDYLYKRDNKDGDPPTYADCKKHQYGYHESGCH